MSQNTFVSGQITSFNKLMDKLDQTTYSVSTRSTYENDTWRARKIIFDIRYDSPSFSTTELENRIKPIYNTIKSKGPEVHKALSQSYEFNQMNGKFQEPEGQLSNYGYNVIRPDELFEAASIYLHIYRTNFPTEDVSEYDAYIKNVTGAYIQERNKSNAFTANYNYFREHYEQLFNPNLPYAEVNVNPDHSEAQAKAYLENYKKEVNAFLNHDAAKLLQGDLDPFMKEYPMGLSQIATKGQELKTLEVDSKDCALNAWYHNQLDQAWIDGMIRLYGDNPELTRQKDGIQKVTDFLVSPEHAIKMGEANAEKRIAERRMYPERMQDAALMTDIKATLARSNFGKGKEIKEIRITTENWTITRHWLSGVVLYREVGVQMVTVENGECILHTFVAKENFNGTSYDKCSLGFHSAAKMLCENVK